MRAVSMWLCDQPETALDGRQTLVRFTRYRMLGKNALEPHCPLIPEGDRRVPVSHAPWGSARVPPR